MIMNLVGVRQNAPQEIKVLMGPGLLIMAYTLVLIVYKASRRLGEKGLENY